MGKRRLGRIGRYASDPWERKGFRHGLYVEEAAGTSEERSPGRLYCDGRIAFDRFHTFCDHLSRVVRYSPTGMPFNPGRFMPLSHYCQSVIIPPVCWITLILASWRSPSPDRSTQAAPF